MRRAEMEMLFGHLYWAAHRLLDEAAALPPERFVEQTNVTTRDLRATLVHELDVERSWRLNLQGRPEEEFASDKELEPESYSDVAALREHWARDEREMLGWLASLDDDALELPVSSRLSGDRRPLWQYLVHILTHGSLQFADAATLLTLAGRSPGELDFGAYLQTLPEAPQVSPVASDAVPSLRKDG